MRAKQVVTLPLQPYFGLQWQSSHREGFVAGLRNEVWAALKGPNLENTSHSRLKALIIHASFDTEYDRAKVPPYNGNDPHPALVV